MTAGDVWRSFGRWRRRRPFWGCFFFLLSGAELFFTANQSLGGLSVHLGPTGFLSYLLPLIMVICAVLCLVTPAQRLFYGIIGLLDALYSFIGLNLGGFFIGMLLGIIGGALVIAWGPPRPKPANPDFVPIADQIRAEQEAAAQGSPAEPGAERPGDAETQQLDIAGHDDRPAEEQVRPMATHEPGFVPGFDDDQERPKSGSTPSRLSKNPKALTVALIVIGLTAGVLAVGSRIPASAGTDCPAGMPSRSVSATSTTAAAEKAAAGTAAKTSSSSKKKAVATTKTAPKTAQATPSTASPSPPKSGNKVVDGVKAIIDGVGNLLGVGDDPSSPSTSPTPSQTPTATAAPGPTATPTADPTKTGAPAPTDGPTTTAGSKSPSPSASDDIIPCLGARVFGLKANPDDIPLVATKPGLLATDSLTMYDSTYDGVAKLPTTGGGTIRALKFSMKSAVNKPFSLTIDGPGNTQTVLTSKELTTSGTVKFYTQRFEGKLFGVIPVVFTPDQPPPLTLPILWFTDVKIQLNYVRCDKLTGDTLHISQQD